MLVCKLPHMLIYQDFQLIEGQNFHQRYISKKDQDSLSFKLVNLMVCILDAGLRNVNSRVVESGATWVTFDP